MERIRFISISPTEFKVEGYHIYKDCNGQWISTPPIENKPKLQQAVNNHIEKLEK